MFKNLSTEKLGISGTQSELVELTLSYGFKGMDLRLEEFARRVADKGLDYARRPFDSARLKFGSFVLPVSLGSEEDLYAAQLRELPTAVEIAAQINCMRTVTMIEPASDLRPFQENFELHRKRIVEVAEVLQPHDVQLGLEFTTNAGLREGLAFEFIHTPDALQQLVSMIGDTMVGVSVDLWEFHAAGVADDWQSIGVEKIVKITLSDAPEDKSPGSLIAEDRLLPTAGGTIDSAAALVTLAEMGYDGPVSPVADRSRFESKLRDGMARELGEAMDTVWKAAGLTASGWLSAAAN